MAGGKFKPVGERPGLCTITSDVRRIACECRKAEHTLKTIKTNPALASAI